MKQILFLIFSFCMLCVGVSCSNEDIPDMLIGPTNPIFKKYDCNEQTDTFSVQAICYYIFSYGKGRLMCFPPPTLCVCAYQWEQAFCVARGGEMLKQTLGLFAYKVFQVVRHKVGHIFKLLLCYAALGQGKHPFGLGQHVGDEVEIG